jgi:hypothetical protein
MPLTVAGSVIPVLRLALSITLSRRSRTITAPALHHAAQFLHLIGQVANLLLQFGDAGRRERMAHARLGSSAVGPLLVTLAFAFALDALLHFTRHLLQVLRGFIQSCRTQVADCFHEVTEPRAGIALAIGMMTIMIARRPVILLANRWRKRRRGRLIAILRPGSHCHHKGSRT